MIKTMVAQLSARLEKEPNDGKGWAMLGRSLRVLGETDKAKDAYRNAVDRLHIYPDGKANILRAAVAERYKLEPERLTFGDGSDHQPVSATRLDTKTGAFQKNEEAGISKQANQCRDQNESIVMLLRDTLEHPEHQVFPPAFLVPRGLDRAE